MHRRPQGRRRWLSLSSVSDNDVLVVASYPSADDTWTVTGSDMTGGGEHSYAIRAYAICATVAS